MENLDTHGRISEVAIERVRLAAKSSFCSVENPIDRERLMCKGNGAPRSLINEL
jgi:hypothetical protein